jgi:hypothetical protein
LPPAAALVQETLKGAIRAAMPIRGPNSQDAVAPRWALFYNVHIQNPFAGRSQQRVPGFLFRAAGQYSW